MASPEPKTVESGAIQKLEQLVILVVEDEAIIRISAVDMLEDAGFLVLEADNADIAVQILESRSDIRAVFTDIEMPGSLCGLKLAKAIRNRWPPIHLIVTSGRYGVSELDLPRLARFISKPYAATEVLKALGELLGWGPLPTDISPTQH
jgi:two-component system, response regulator PdtaR